MEEENTTTRRKKITRIIIILLVSYGVLNLIYQMARWQPTVFILGVITGILFGVWILVTNNKMQLSRFIEMETTQDMILEQNMVVIKALQRIGAIEKDDSDDLR